MYRIATDGPIRDAVAPSKAHESVRPDRVQSLPVTPRVLTTLPITRRRPLFDRFGFIIFAVGLLLAGAGCDNLFSPERAAGVENGQLTVVRVAPDAPPLEQTTVTFWMVRGQQTEVEIRYLLQDGYNSKCLR